MFFLITNLNALQWAVAADMAEFQNAARALRSARRRLETDPRSVVKALLYSIQVPDDDINIVAGKVRQPPAKVDDNGDVSPLTI